jgi:hypothetical protein
MKLLELKTKRFYSIFQNIHKDFYEFFVKNEAYLGGGAIRSVLNKEKINDLDFFFSNPDQKSRFVQFLKDIGSEEIFACPKGELFTYKKNDIKIQVIANKYFQQADDLIGTFDFEICMCCLQGNTLTTYDDVLRTIRDKKLTINRITFPSASLKRMSKYISYGYKADEKFYQDFIYAIRTSNFNEPQIRQVYID